MTLRVLIVHEHLAHAEALAALVDSQPDLRSVRVVTSTGDARVLLASEAVDVMLIDLHQAVAGAVRSDDLDVRVVAMTGAVTGSTLEQALEVGACGLVGRDAPASEVLSSLRSTAPRMTVSGTTLDLLLADARGWLELRHPQMRRPDHVVHLTQRERQVLQLMRDGLDAKTIASDLHVSVHTARSHIKKLLAKLGAHSQLEAVAIANRLGVESNDRPN